ncbi:hypothetical protein [Candidatus Rhabdochlamydia sp. T3358]|uniref:hypothetical protein n=1 Tax=Candidatus Rhabdochlamydia sp. T3358 TaxID=2099795 RepID=UPI0010B050D6|nr:hypothetical protein [Candidatus Rhabdochlamydia sp. T3358]VHO05327.1 hypothetical protein RHT_01716 [Candidatus Rhabdochlamydia sp. T3358]
MTISRILNSFNFYTPRIQAEPQIQAEIKPENTVHTWHLANGSKAYLIRNNDLLECQLINGQDSIKVQVPFPDFLTPEEAINLLLRKYPILRDNDTIDFIENEEELHTWDVKYENPVSAVRVGEDLYYSTIWEGPQGEKDLVMEKISTPKNLSLSERIAWVMERHPHVYQATKRVPGQPKQSTCIVEFKEKITQEKSAVDGKTPLDMNNWCVTMFNAENSNSFPCTWVGHASLVIETIEEGGYFSRVVHLTKENGIGVIKFLEASRESVKKRAKEVSKTETWSRPKEDIQKMINQVFLEVTHQKNGDPLVFFKLDSGKMLELVRRSALELHGPSNSFTPLSDAVKRRIKREDVAAAPLEENYMDEYNCIEYSIRNLSIANIKVLLRSGCLLSKTCWPTPVLYTGSRVKALVQEASLITSYTTLFAGSAAFWGTLIAGRTGAGIAATLGAGFALREIFYAYKIEPPSKQELETKEEEKKA